MRTLIIVKRGGEALTNRDVTNVDVRQATINDLMAAYPEDDIQFFTHKCGKSSCTEEEFTPQVKPAPEPEKKPKPMEVKPMPKGKKKEQAQAMRHSNSNNR